MKREERIYNHAKVSEKALERKMCQRVRERGCLPVKINDVNQCGLPDRLVALPGGSVIWVEMKSQGAKPTPLQKQRIAELRRMGFSVYVIDSEELIEELVMMIDSLFA